MKKVLLVLPALAILCLATTVRANEGAIDSATLSAMGLSDVQVMSDNEASTVRGQGYNPRRSLSLSFGLSYSYVEGEGAVSHQGSGFEGSTGSLDGFVSYGNHYTAGEHYSKSSITQKKTETTTSNGITVKSVKTNTLSVGSQGGAWSIAI